MGTSGTFWLEVLRPTKAWIFVNLINSKVQIPIHSSSEANSSENNALPFPQYKPHYVQLLWFTHYSTCLYRISLWAINCKQIPIKDATLDEEARIEQTVLFIWCSDGNLRGKVERESMGSQTNCMQQLWSFQTHLWGHQISCHSFSFLFYVLILLFKEALDNHQSWRS